MAITRLNNNSVVSVSSLPNLASLPSGVGAVAMADVWRLASNHSSSSITSTVVGWERVDDATFSNVGSGMTESSGVFSFPSTGKYLIQGIISFNSAGSDSNYNEVFVEGTSNNSTYDTLATNSDDIQSSTNERGATSYVTIFNCTNTSTHKIRFSAFSQNAVTVLGDSNISRTHVMFIKLSET